MKEEAEEFVVKKKRLSDKGKFEEGSVTSADEVPIHTGENIKKDEGDSRSMRAESIIGTYGGTLEIPYTGVSLRIPPGALRREYFIRMKIIPHHYLDESELSFASNSSVVVELLPNNVKLLIPATLTLPHCLVLKKKCERKAKVYSSHHKKGYYWRLPSCQQVLKMNRCIVLKEMPVVFYKKGELPLTISFEKVVPPNWTYNEENHNKEISFDTIAITEGSFCTFLLNKMASDETDGYACYFKAGQGSDLKDLIFPLTESSQPRTEATLPSMGFATAGDTHEELPSTIAQTTDSDVSEESLQYLSEHIGEHWKFVGRNLGVTEEQFSNIEQKVDASLKEKTYQMLRVWKMKMASAATYDVLGEALRKAGRVDLQEDLLRIYQPT
ncbi:hypothetical protein BSL78_23408 [Apostichopus japonicus]|uniref:Netrin receptor UNC5 n=1 Tax=Stichopus japonicus TaxID=307972 RepID=A0A2G8JVK5_STIJA|nr:hypothetical protein BSL78_23408 [Apostichopus japonicus]